MNSKALHEICYSPEISVPALELLLACKANVASINDPLIVASRMNQTTVVEHLLKAGADVDDGGSMNWPRPFRNSSNFTQLWSISDCGLVRKLSTVPPRKTKQL
jgi:hypothetical protein